MPILKVARMGNPVLKARAQEVIDPQAPEITRLLIDMMETMFDEGGVGLAAPQVHVPLRVIVYKVPGERNEGQEIEPSVLINPLLTPLDERQDDGIEGCLSLPGMCGVVPRFYHIHYSGLNQKGEKVEGEATGYFARVLQHECDHLDGVLYPMRMPDLSLFGYTEEMRKGGL